MGFILKDQKFSLVWFDRHHRFLAVLTYWPFSLLAHHTETSLSWQFWPPEKKYERRIKHHFLTNKNVFGFPRGRSEAEIGEAICQLVFFFCIASRLAELALSFTKIWFSLWGPAVVYSIFASIFNLSQSLLRISSSAKGAFCRHQFGVFSFFVGSFSCVKEKGVSFPTVYM